MTDHSRTQIFLHLDSGVFPIQTLEGSEAVNDCLDLCVTTSSRLTSGFTDSESRALIGTFATLQIRSGDTERWWYGDIAAVHESWDRGRHFWKVKITNKLQRGTLQTRTKLWMQLSRKELIYRLLEDMGYYRYEITWSVDEVSAPNGPFLQAQESNYDFFKRLLAEVGANFWFNHDADMLHEQLILSNSPYLSKYLPNIEWVQRVSGLSPSHRRNRIVSVLPEFNAVSTRYGAATNAALHHSNRADASQNSLTPTHVNHELFTPPRPEAEATQRALFAQQHANQKALLLEIVSHQPLLTAGHSLVMESSRCLGYQLEQGDIRLVSVQHKASTLSDGSGLQYSNTAVALPRETPIRPERIEPQHLPQFFAARIESQHEYAQLTQNGYYRFRPEFETPTERSEYSHAQASPLVERILPYSSPKTKEGEAVGWHFPMLNDSSILVTCLNNDPNRMAIVGFIPSLGKDGPVSDSNQTQHRIVTSSQNELLMDDSPNNHRFALFTFDGQTMLDLFGSDKEHYIRLTCIYGGINLNASLTVQMSAQESIVFEAGQQIDIKAKQQASIITENDAITFQSAEEMNLESKNNLSITSTEGDVSIWAQAKPITQHAKNGLMQTVSGGNAETLIQGGSTTVQVNGGEMQLESQGDIVITDGTGGIKIDQQGNIKLWGSNVYFDSNSVTFDGEIEYDSGGNESESAPELQVTELTETALLELEPVEHTEGEPARYVRSAPVVNEKNQWTPSRTVRPLPPSNTLKSSLLKTSTYLEKLANENEACVSRGSKRKGDVKRIQRALIAMNFDLGRAGVDGDFGPTTQKRVEDFQKTFKETHTIHLDYQIGESNGTVNRGTLLGLDEALVGEWKNNDDEMDMKWLTVPKGALTFDSEGDDIEGSIYFTRVAHVPNNNGKVIDNSGITIGRGLDIGCRDANEVAQLFAAAAKNAEPISDKLLNWLKGGAGKKKNAAYDYWLTLDKNVPKDEQTITRKMQHYLFLEIYADYQKKAKHLTTKADVCKEYLGDEKKKVDWDALPQNVKDVLIDLTYRGDYTGSKDKRGNTRKQIVPAIYKDQQEGLSGETSNFYGVMLNKKEWTTKFKVDENRIISRIGTLE
ncbi:pesticin C-terminus-like muramidase [Marinomonas balearica]|uniref:Uncharacterized protein involved in type VI secretion and phage assembly n=1 Tax=Marinomonas balearica TaxID=491947 RepID=A0A4R6MDH1_9GAMM|nr:pesticin C-terminus-like muramidase [Marinomonas balearica]TDO99758.1 uncharacterized protein involved in type VI secretion and phage assembly [Marinomonas balearica]